MKHSSFVGTESSPGQRCQTIGDWARDYISRYSTAVDFYGTVFWVLRAMKKSYQRRSLEYLVQGYYKQQCVDVRDKIYACLGLLNGEHRRPHIRPDYSITPTQLFCSLVASLAPDQDRVAASLVFWEALGLMSHPEQVNLLGSPKSADADGNDRPWSLKVPLEFLKYHSTKGRGWKRPVFFFMAPGLSCSPGDATFVVFQEQHTTKSWGAMNDYDKDATKRMQARAATKRPTPIPFGIFTQPLLRGVLRGRWQSTWKKLGVNPNPAPFTRIMVTPDDRNYGGELAWIQVILQSSHPYLDEENRFAMDVRLERFLSILKELRSMQELGEHRSKAERHVGILPAGRPVKKWLLE